MLQQARVLVTVLGDFPIHPTKLNKKIQEQMTALQKYTQLLTL